MRPSDIGYSQDSIAAHFGKNTPHRYLLIGDTLDQILSGKCRISDIPTITVSWRRDKYYSADNRRLWIFRKLEELGECDEIPVRIGYINPAKFTTNCSGRSISVRGAAGGILWREKTQTLKDISNVIPSNTHAWNPQLESGQFSNNTILQNNVDQIIPRLSSNSSSGRPLNLDLLCNNGAPSPLSARSFFAGPSSTSSFDRAVKEELVCNNSTQSPLPARASYVGPPSTSSFDRPPEQKLVGNNSTSKPLSVRSSFAGPPSTSSIDRPPNQPLAGTNSTSTPSFLISDHFADDPPFDKVKMLKPSQILYSKYHVNCKYGTQSFGEKMDEILQKEKISIKNLEVYRCGGKFYAVNNSVLWLLQLAEHYDKCDTIKCTWNYKLTPFGELLQNGESIVVTGESKTKILGRTIVSKTVTVPMNSNALVIVRQSKAYLKSNGLSNKNLKDIFVVVLFDQTKIRFISSNVYL